MNGDPLTNEELDALYDADFHRRTVARLSYQLHHHPPTDPALRARLQRELEYSERAIAASTIDDHWATGAGDRTLF